jgi:KilA-N domain
MSILKSTLRLSNIVIESRKSDNFINATQLCKAGGKKFSHWYPLDSTKELIKELENNLKNCEAGIPASRIKLVDIIKGNSKVYKQGTWIHPDLAIQLAQWISPVFSIQVSRWIRELFIVGNVSINSKKSDEELKKLQFKLEEKDKLLLESKEQLEEQKKNIKKLEKKQLRLEEFVEVTKELKKEQVFYLATTDAYSKQHRYEFGGVKNIKDVKSRLAGYNIGRAEGDLFYITKIFRCHSYKMLEDRIHDVFKHFKDKKGSRKEMLIADYDILLEIVEIICDNYDGEVDVINARCQELLNKIVNTEGSKKESINLDEITVRVEYQGTERTRKIDTKDWSKEQINEAIENIINHCVLETNKIIYNVKEQKDSLAVELPWGAISTYMKKKYKGLSPLEWRDKFREWFSIANPKQLRIKNIKL